MVTQGVCAVKKCQVVDKYTSFCLNSDAVGRWLKFLIFLPVVLTLVCGCGTQPADDSSTEPSLEAEFTLKTPNEGISIVTRTPTLSWTCSVENASFRLQLSTDRNFARPIIDMASLSVSSYDVPAGKLTHDKTYYWRVSATKGGKTSNWSTIWTFKTVFLP